LNMKKRRHSLPKDALVSAFDITTDFFCVKKRGLCIVYNRKELKLCTVVSGFYCYYAAAVKTAAAEIPVRIPAVICPPADPAPVVNRTHGRRRLRRPVLRGPLMRTVDVITDSVRRLLLLFQHPEEQQRRRQHNRIRVSEK